MVFCNLHCTTDILLKANYTAVQMAFRHLGTDHTVLHHFTQPCSAPGGLLQLAAPPVRLPATRGVLAVTPPGGDPLATGVARGQLAVCPGSGVPGGHLAEATAGGAGRQLHQRVRAGAASSPGSRGGEDCPVPLSEGEPRSVGWRTE